MRMPGSKEDKVTLSRPRRRTALIGFALIAFAALLAGFLASTPQLAEVAHAAACKASNGWCLYNYRTAAVDVYHLVPGGGGVGSDTPVEPDTGESIDITAYWNSNNAPCQEVYETASVDVSWSGTGWTLSNKTATTNIVDIQLCGEDTCAAEDTHSYGYKLYVKVNDPVWTGGPVHNLRQVVFATTSVDDGYELDTTNCVLGSAVTPTTQTVSATDSGTFECGYACANNGTTLNITYE